MSSPYFLSYMNLRGYEAFKFMPEDPLLSLYEVHENDLSWFGKLEYLLHEGAIAIRKLAEYGEPRPNNLGSIFDVTNESSETGLQVSGGLLGYLTGSLDLNIKGNLFVTVNLSDVRSLQCSKFALGECIETMTWDQSLKKNEYLCSNHGAVLVNEVVYHNGFHFEVNGDNAFEANVTAELDRIEGKFSAKAGFTTQRSVYNKLDVSYNNFELPLAFKCLFIRLTRQYDEVVWGKEDLELHEIPPQPALIHF